MRVEKEKLLTIVCPHQCGIYYDPLAEGYIDTCDDCFHESREIEGDEPEDRGSKSFYLGACGLIAAYIL